MVRNAPHRKDMDEAVSSRAKEKSLDKRLRKLLEDAENGIKHCCGQRGCNDTTTDQIELLTATLKALQASTGAELTKFTLSPTFIEGHLTKVDVALIFDPMLEEE